MGVRGKRPVPNIVPVSDIITDSKIEKIIIKGRICLSDFFDGSSTKK